MYLLTWCATSQDTNQHRYELPSIQQMTTCYMCQTRQSAHILNWIVTEKHNSFIHAQLSYLIVIIVIARLRYTDILYANECNRMTSEVITVDFAEFTNQFTRENRTIKEKTNNETGQMSFALFLLSFLFDFARMSWS